jgi:hypothetical protein
MKKELDAQWDSYVSSPAFKLHFSCDGQILLHLKPSFSSHPRISNYANFFQQKGKNFIRPFDFELLLRQKLCSINQ